MDRNHTMQVVVVVVDTSLSARRAWIEMKIHREQRTEFYASLSARRAWIEIMGRHEEPFRSRKVALRKESVDRNMWWGVRKAVGSLVALRKESVDRNGWRLTAHLMMYGSLSARRAWIEIRGMACKETGITPSLSARRAWIEIMGLDGRFKL